MQSRSREKDLFRFGLQRSSRHATASQSMHRQDYRGLSGTDHARRGCWRLGRSDRRDYMDSKQFDELVARLASAATRRSAVKGVLGGTLASVGVASVASADKKSCESKKNKARCNGKCKNINNHRR